MNKRESVIRWGVNLVPTICRLPEGSDPRDHHPRGVVAPRASPAKWRRALKVAPILPSTLGATVQLLRGQAWSPKLLYHARGAP